MFTGNFQENKTSTGKFPGMSHEAFLDFLHFIYTDSVRNIKAHIIELLEVSDLYEVEGLKKICEAQLLRGLSEENSGDIFQYAHRYRCQVNLKRAAFELIKKYFKYLFFYMSELLYKLITRRSLAKNNYNIPDEHINYPEAVKKIIDTRNNMMKLLQPVVEPTNAKQKGKNTRIVAAECIGNQK